MRPWLTIDIETRSAINLKTHGVYVYASHATALILCITWKYCGGPVRSWSVWGHGNATLEELSGYLRNDQVMVWAHNAEFERVCFESDMGLAIGLPSIPLWRWRCSQVLARVNGLPSSLDDIGSVLDLAIKKDRKGKALIQQLCVPNKEGVFVPIDARDKRFDELLDYCCTDTESEELIVQHPALRDPGDVFWADYAIHERINDYGVRVDVPAIADMLLMIDSAKKPLETECLQLTSDVETYTKRGVLKQRGLKPSQTTALREWLSDRLLSLDDLDKDAVALALARTDLPDDMRRVLEIRYEYAKASVSKYQSMNRARGVDDRVRGMQVFSGAHTGRPTGSLVQLYNLPRKTEKKADVVKQQLHNWNFDFEDPLSVASSMIRPMLIPSEGNTFVIADYNAIEARGVGWLADDQLYLAEYRGEGKLYESMAADVYGVRKEQILKDTIERFLGKTIILGCGYQMGLKKFIDTAQKQAREQGLPPFDIEVLTRAHARYRERHRDGVVANWYATQEAAMSAIRNPGKVFSVSDGKLKFAMRGDAMVMRLPSGRTLVYHNACIQQRPAPWQTELPMAERDLVDQIVFMGWHTSPRGWREKFTYGGKLVENAVQGFCNDLLRFALQQLRGDKHFSKVVLHVYDEVVAELPKRLASPGAVRAFSEIICRKPSWATGLPMAAEAKLSDWYTK